MGHALRYRDESELPESIRKRLQKRFGEKKPAAIATPRARKPRRDIEHTEQVVFFNRIRALAANDPTRYGMAAKRTVAIPNGGGRSRAEAGRLKAEGVTKGVSDIFVAWPHEGWCGMFIEMKAPDGRVSEEQSQWLFDSVGLGYRAFVCYGADEATNVWRAYVDGDDSK